MIPFVLFKKPPRYRLASGRGWSLILKDKRVVAMVKCPVQAGMMFDRLNGGG